MFSSASQFVVSVCILQLLLGAGVDGFAWNSKLDYPNPTVDSGDLDGDELTSKFANDDHTGAVHNTSSNSLDNFRDFQTLFESKNDHIAPSDQALFGAYQIL